MGRRTHQRHQHPLQKAVHGRQGPSHCRLASMFAAGLGGDCLIAQQRHAGARRASAGPPSASLVGRWRPPWWLARSRCALLSQTEAQMCWHPASHTGLAGPSPVHGVTDSQVSPIGTVASTTHSLGQIKRFSPQIKRFSARCSWRGTSFALLLDWISSTSAFGVFERPSAPPAKS